MNMIKNRVDFHRIRIINHDCSCTTLVVVNISEYSNSLRKCIASIVVKHCLMKQNFAIAVVNPFGLTISKNLKDWKNQK